MQLQIIFNKSNSKHVGHEISLVTKEVCFEVTSTIMCSSGMVSVVALVYNIVIDYLHLQMVAITVINEKH